LSKRLKLTEEGKDYAKRGLPELNLAEALKQGPISLSRAKELVNNLDIALQWGKKKNWIRMDGGLIYLISSPDVVPEQEALIKALKGETIDEEVARVLIQRNLIEVESSFVEELKHLEGKTVSRLTPELMSTGLWRNVKLRPYDVKILGAKVHPSKRQPFDQVLSELRQRLVELGFVEMKGPTIETEFWNYDALYQPQGHPARDWLSTFYLKGAGLGDLPSIAGNVRKAHEHGVSGSTGWGYKWDPMRARRLMPRAQGTALSARTLAKGPLIPGKYFAIARCYRPDVIDAFHGIEFVQVEGIVVDESLTFRNLLGILEMFAKEIAKANEIKFIPDYYPFTEPSVQMSAKHPAMGWIEFGGAGIFREELTKPLNVDVPVIAWGLGVDRLAMFKLGIEDIRDLFSRDLDWMRRKAVV
jgi:phenylalanyl-tRNA synthetase alpha chain